MWGKGSIEGDEYCRSQNQKIYNNNKIKKAIPGLVTHRTEGKDPVRNENTNIITYSVLDFILLLL